MTDIRLDWIDTEYDMYICSPFSPKEKLSQCNNTTNPILIHSKKIWANVHQMYRVPHLVQPFASLWFNPAIHVGKVSVFWKQWHSRGISTIGDSPSSLILGKGDQILYISWVRAFFS